MKYFLVLLIFLTASNFASAQIEVNGGMGIEFTSAQSLNDYLTANGFVTFEERNTEFRTNVVFFIEGCKYINENFQLGIGYDLSIYSYNFAFPDLGTYKAEYEMHKPSLMAYYVIPGKGYNFKLGGGIGVRYITLTETIPTLGGTEYSSTGMGFLFKAVGNTTLGQNLYAQIGGALGFDFPGVPDNNGDSFSYNNEEQKKVNINSFSAGIRLGLTYYF